MTPIEVILVGLGVVFVTLGILTGSTYLFSWIIDKYFVKEEEDELEKVAAIVASIRSRGDVG